MIFAQNAIRASVVFFSALSVNAQTTPVGGDCNAGSECASGCCGVLLEPSSCLASSTLPLGGECGNPNGCDCQSGICVNGACAECFGTRDCQNGECCATNQSPPICVAPRSTISGDNCLASDGCDCMSGNCPNGTCAACPVGVDTCDDPHMQGLHGQTIDWSGIDGGWYCLVTDTDVDVHVNVRLTAPLPEDFPDRQLITALSILSGGHSLIIEVANPYNVDTDGCPGEISPCLSDGGLRAIVDGNEEDGLLRSSRDEHVADGIVLSASNLPFECREFGGDKIWAHMYDEMMQGSRELHEDEGFEDWILRFDHMAASDWCTKYIAQHNLADLQSSHAVFKIVASAITVRLNVGTNFQGNGELDWDGRVIPDLEFWQMDVGFHGLSIESETLSGIFGETARPVIDKDGHEVMNGNEALRGTVADYRVSGPLGTEFALKNRS